MHMENGKFQEELLEDIQKSLGKSDVPLARIKELANAALKLEDRYPEGIPDNEAQKLLQDFGDIAMNTRQAHRERSETVEKGKIEKIRRSLGLKNGK